MSARAIETVFIISVLSFFFLLSIFQFDYEIVEIEVNELVFKVADNVSTNAVLTQNDYHYLTRELKRYGDYKVTFKLSKKLKEGIYDTYYDQSVIIDQPLRRGDELKIVVTEQSYNLLTRLINAPIAVLKKNSKFIDNRIVVHKTAFITKDAKNTVKGYDVMVDIQTSASDPNKVIFVTTKLNPAGKYYRGELYGDSSDEISSTGINHIFENGDFIKETEDLYGTTTVSYIQY